MYACKIARDFYTRKTNLEDEKNFCCGEGCWTLEFRKKNYSIKNVWNKQKLNLQVLKTSISKHKAKPHKPIQN